MLDDPADNECVPEIVSKLVQPDDLLAVRSARAQFLQAWKEWDESCYSAARNADEKKRREGAHYRPHPTGPDPRKTERFVLATENLAGYYDVPALALQGISTRWRTDLRWDRERALRAFELGLGAAPTKDPIIVAAPSSSADF